MGFIADEPLGDLLDEQGLDHAGKSLRDQQRKAQAIDRDLPDNTGIDQGEENWFPGPSDHAVDAMRHQQQIQRHIQDAMGLHPRFVAPKGMGKAYDAFKKAYGGAITGSAPFVAKDAYADLNDKELAQEWHDAMAAGKHQLGRIIQTEAKRRKDEGANA